MPLSIQAGLWGLLGGLALVLGAAIAWFASLPQRLVAGVMALGAGVLISAVAFDLMDEAFNEGGLLPTAGGFLAGALVYTLANVALARHGARHRKRSGHASGAQQPEAGSGGLAIAVGALLDGIPESVVIGVSLLGGAGVSISTVAAVFLSNMPEGLSSAAGMRRAGRPASYVFGVWGGIALASGLAALIGNLALADAPPEVTAATNAVAAGAILAMLADTMIPEAFETAHDYAGLITVAGFLVAFALAHLGGG
ncbi:ZIP family zinc transporter [Roseomonas sp. M0104]|uniref:ZIP family zinc transporter n=1 Tax=Teichococcus coralli TaxID=2545983 RepID=A0A845BHK3_9PROT|nr:ZIP family zinc transporter [Pseudoroseomonas coralli]MXP64682.1 ZIP family zinc transporter [Pseudoroseomonas coralli]